MDKTSKFVAAFDLGTNTFNLTISDVIKPFPPVYTKEIGVFLGKGGLENKIILPASLKRAQSALKEYLDVLKKYNIVQITAVATEAIRNAKNGIEILDTLDSEYSFSIRKITGNREAELTWKGVKAAKLLTEKTAMIIDIGGASTEVIIANYKHFNWRKSFKIGVSRALEMHPISDLPSEEDMFTLSSYFKSEMKEIGIVLKEYKPEILIGTAGAFDSWRINLENRSKYKIPYYKFDENKLLGLIERINSTSLQNRSMIKGIPEIRNETIVPAGILIQNILDIYDFNSIYQCSYSLAEGLINEMVDKQL